MFGDDAPLRNTEAGFTVGFQALWSPSPIAHYAGPQGEGDVEAGLALGVAVGHRVAMGSRWQMSPEFFWRATGGPGFGTPSYGAQVAMGRRTR